jgi:hypothetical protein
LVAVREELEGQDSSLPPGAGDPSRFSIVPADCLLDLPPDPTPPRAVEVVDPAAAADFLKGTYQTEARQRCLEERRRFVSVCRDYLDRSFDARIRAAQDRVMKLRTRESSQPEIALARQRAENELADLVRTQKERLSGLDRLILVRPGPVHHVATALVLPPRSDTPAGPGQAPEDVDTDLRRRSEKAAEDMAVAFETSRGWECQRVGHLKIGFDIRSLGPADPQTGYRDPVQGIRRIEVKGRSRGFSIRLTTNEWYKAAQLGDSYWLYVVWDPLGPSPELVTIRNPAARLDHAKREVIAARFFDIPADAILAAARESTGE